jgi:hypothetical protein
MHIPNQAAARGRDNGWDGVVSKVPGSLPSGNARMRERMGWGGGGLTVQSPGVNNLRAAGSPGPGRAVKGTTQSL